MGLGLEIDFETCVLVEDNMRVDTVRVRVRVEVEVRVRVLLVGDSMHVRILLGLVHASAYCQGKGLVHANTYCQGKGLVHANTYCLGKGLVNANANTRRTCSPYRRCRSTPIGAKSVRSCSSVR